MKLYWLLRHFLWDVREWILVREISRKMHGVEELYVHPRNGGPARWVIHPTGRTWPPRKDIPHDHVEGRRRQ